MNGQIPSVFELTFSARFAVLLLGACLAYSPAIAQQAIRHVATTGATQPDIRFGGALDTSFQYHRQRATVAPGEQSGERYRYGFPVETYRWGWFGASRYYPTVVCHRGHSGDQCRWAYRYGY
jgi:hypothetical protein